MTSLFDKAQSKGTLVGISAILVLILVGNFWSAHSQEDDLLWVLYHDNSVERRSRALRGLVALDVRKFRGVNLAFAALSGADLQKVRLRGSSFLDANLHETNFTEADLRIANFKRSSLKKTNLTRCDLRGAVFSKANFEQTILTGANLSGVEGLTVEQICQCKNIENVKGLSNEFMQKIKERRPELMQWWDGKTRHR